MQIALFDNDSWRIKLFPLSLTRPVSNLRVGILTIDQKWSKYFNVPVSFITENYLDKKFPLNASPDAVLIIQGNILPDERLCEKLHSLKIGEALVSADTVIAFKTEVSNPDDISSFHFNKLNPKDYNPVFADFVINRIDYPEDLFRNNGEEIKKDFELITKGRTSAPLSSTNQLLGDNIFLEEGVSAEFATFNTTKGPIYLGKSSQVWEGSLVRGPFALCDQSILKMGTRVYSNVTVGPDSTVGGELNTCVIWGNSNKGHDGYLGSSVMGEWCNWGADTNNSNMKNNFKDVRMYDYQNRNYRATGLQFCGAIMGDHVRCSINTAFNTGTVVGVSANIFGGGVPPTFIPDFSWGGAAGFAEYDLEKMFQTSELVFRRRNRKFDEIEQNLLQSVYNLTKNYRKF